MTNKAKIREVVFHALTIAFALFMLYPLLWMLSSSFKQPGEIFKNVSFLPTSWTLDNYIQGWAGISGNTFARFFGNSFLIVGVAILGNVVSCSLAAYAFSKLEFKFKNFWFAIMLGTLMLPMHVRLIPQYIIYNNIGWVNTYWPLIFPKFLATDGFFIFMMTQYMRGLPKELDEASTVDGCGFFRHYASIIMPLSVPTIITTSIFTFIWTWNDFFSQMIYLSDIKSYTVALALRMYVDAMGNSYWGALFAMSVLSLVPLMVMFICFQTYLVEGITAGSVKG